MFQSDVLRQAIIASLFMFIERGPALIEYPAAQMPSLIGVSFFWERVMAKKNKYVILGCFVLPFFPKDYLSLVDSQIKRLTHTKALEQVCVKITGKVD